MQVRPDRVVSTTLRVLLVEDDDGDALLVSEFLQDASDLVGPVELIRARRLDEAAAAVAVDDFDCVLLDLHLPDADGLAGLTRLRRLAPGTAHVVLTGLADSHQGLAAMSAGAQDYLVKGQVDGELLGRSLRYAIERHQADESERALFEANIVAEENARLERGLLPRPLVTAAGVDVHVRYRPGRRRALLGGDFYDVVQDADGVVRAVIGDVSGHGADEAALGVCLRVAWRTLVLAGAAEGDVLPGVEQILLAERPSDEVFATAVMLSLDTATGELRVRRAGHPAPVVVQPGGSARQLAFDDPGPALGIVPGTRWEADVAGLPDGSRLLLFTDGLVEGRTPGGGRLGDEGLVELLTARSWPEDAERALDALIDAVEALNGEPLADDVALLRLGRPLPGQASVGQ
ncbi:MAG TPA: fused response regulator/phosphatase [Jiangellales bacterium]|nr:fused response regulator/phosphatase [Jiangellales bacterium]